MTPTQHTTPIHNLMIVTAPSPRLIVGTTIPLSPTSSKPSCLKFRPAHLSSTAAYSHATNENARPSSPCYDNDQVLISSPKLTLYDILGIEMNATNEEIKAAYRRLVHVYHPDVVAVAKGKDASADEFMKINSAYSTLMDPLKRANYDLKLTRQLRRPPQFTTLGSPTAPTSGFASYTTRRSWETDQCW